MISVDNVSKQYGKRVLFSKVSLNINPEEKIGLIGPNGAGKSTLFSLILQEMEPSEGAVRIKKGTAIGHLPQEASFRSEHTVLSELTEGNERIKRLLQEKDGLEGKNLAASARYGDVLHELEATGYFELEHKAKKILSGLGFHERDFKRPITAMSGGWQMRVLLAKLLTYHYDLLLLDEPTNYLDLNAALWLKDYLASFQGAFVMISHDKAFLTEVTNYTLVLEHGHITKVHGNYEQYQRIKDEQRRHLTRQFKEQEKKVKQLERYAERFHAQPNKASSVRAKRREIERIAEQVVVVPPDPRESIGTFRFPETTRSGYRVMQLQKVSKSYGDIQVYKDFDFEVIQGEKAVLVGENGAGKSTLLKMLAGVVDIDSGSRIVGHKVEAGYFSQTRMDVLHSENTVLAEAYSAAPGYMAEEMVRTILGAFLFTGDDSDKKISVLSGGEKSRLILAKLLINPPNFLLLDEPTTHLDVDAVDALVKALTDYQGTIVFISHDIHFVRSVANNVFEVKNGSIRKFPGNFDYYLSKRQDDAAEERQAMRHERQESPEQREKEREQASQKKMREEKSRRKAHNAVLGAQIAKLEKKKEQLMLESYAKARVMASPRFFDDGERAAEYGRRLKEIDALTAEIDKEIADLQSQMISSE